ncbi:MAG: hypothetical protein EXS46_03930 [Candidatus Taylorbacteria bacterium]|nr:hypothetical protein [Candidatus Taylorbacteria bacterium]
MSGPYFNGQIALAPCGCYYPDVTVIQDDIEALVRHYHCVNCGNTARDLTFFEEVNPTIRPIPDEDWRDLEKVRLRKLVSAISKQ